jgi:hypothetical protein
MQETASSVGSAMIRHIEAGIGFNGMIVWKVDPARIEETGRS